MHTAARDWFFYIGILLFVIGIYGVLRIGFNSFVLAQYPTDGAIPSNILTPSSYSYGFQRASDCLPYPQSYFDPMTNAARPATTEEKKNEEITTERCLQGIAEDRQRAKTTDMGTAAFFLATGLGLLVATKSKRIA